MLTSIHMVTNAGIHLNAENYLLQHSNIVTLTYSTMGSSQIHSWAHTLTHRYTLMHSVTRAL